jgi:hypothetical protein
MLGFSPIGVGPLGWVPDDAAPSGITGTANIALGALTGTGAARLPIVGGASAPLDPVTLVSTGALATTGQAAITLGDLTASGTGSALIGGQGSVTLGAVTLAATGSLAITGSASITLGALTGFGQGGAGDLPPLAGTASVTLGGLTINATGSLPIRGSAAITLGGITLVARAGGSRQAIRFLQFEAKAKRPISYRAQTVDLAFIAKAIAVDFPARRKRIHFIAENGENSMRKLPEKLVDEVWQCTMDCTAWIPEGATLTAFAADSISGDLDLTDFDVVDGNTGTWRVSAGAAGTNTFKVLATMSDGQIFGDTFSVLVN